VHASDFLCYTLLNFLHNIYLIPFYTSEEIIYVDTSEPCSYTSIALLDIMCYSLAQLPCICGNIIENIVNLRIQYNTSKMLVLLLCHCIAPKNYMDFY
jgi:hypothetical protein